jgi:fructokinase
MCTFLGSSLDLSPSDIRVDLLTASKYLYVTAYLWDTEGQKQSVQFAMQTAKDAQVKVCLSLSDPFCVHRHKDALLQLVNRNVDVVMGNRLEAQALTDTDSAEDAARALAKHTDIAVVTLDSAGSLICSNGELQHIPAVQATPVDTTGAGDMYAAGFLYGLTNGYDLRGAGQIASYVAAKTVSQFGPRLESVDLNEAVHYTVSTTS